jgi:glycosyltransferase involved in cell wall biosynthesis
MNTSPLISILIPCYNAERWIVEAIESALAQTWPNKEVIVVDDGSTDKSLDAIRSFGDRIRWETGPNRGGNVARNRLLELATGEWLQYLDADDYLMPDKIAGQFAAVIASPHADLVYSPITLEYWRNEEAPWSEQVAVPKPYDPWFLIAKWAFPGTHAVIMRRSAVADVGGWKPDQPCCQEHELFVRLLKAGKEFAYCPQPGAVYRHWSDGSVCKKNPMLTIAKRLELVDAVEQHLIANGELTPLHQDAIACSRLECERSMYQFDRYQACSTARKARAAHRHFKLPRSPAFPWRYRIAYRAFGFAAAEWLANRTRPWRRTTRRPAQPSTIQQQISFERHNGVPKSAMIALAHQSLPRVSILIPCYNAEQWIGRAIESALQQSWKNKEVIVVDDGSTDQSLEVIRSFGDRIHWETGPNRGGNVARNRLLEIARGEWLQYLDADDYLLPTKISSQMLCGLSLAEIDVLYSRAIHEYSEAGRVVRIEKLPLPKPHDPWILQARWLLPQTGGGLFRKAAIEEVGGWKSDQICCQEHELYLRLLKGNKRFVFCPFGGAVYRQWSNHTVCKKDPRMSLLKRLEVTDELEAHLLQVNEMTAPRQDAIAHARLECARIMYLMDRDVARDVANNAAKQNPGFRPPPAKCFPVRYRLAYRFLGFSSAERLACVLRRKQSVDS